jgi:hypothetical protein
MINDKSVLHIAKENLCLIFLQFVWESSNTNINYNNSISKSFDKFQKSINELRAHSVPGKGKKKK